MSFNEVSTPYKRQKNHKHDISNSNTTDSNNNNASH